MEIKTSFRSSTLAILMSFGVMLALTARADNVLYLDGSTYVDIGTKYALGDSVSLSAWVRVSPSITNNPPKSTSGSDTYWGAGIVGQGYWGGSPGLGLYVSAGIRTPETSDDYISAQVRAANASSANQTYAFLSYTNANLYAPGVWHHYLLVRNTTDGTAKLYTDGVLSMSKPFSTTASITPTVNFAIGKNIQNVGGIFRGYVAEVAIWGEALTAGDAALLTKRSPDEIGKAPHAYFPLGEGSGTKIVNKKNGAQYSKTAGTLRWVDDANFIRGGAGTITVTGDPCEVGSPDPGYGEYEFMVDDVVPFSCPATATTNGQPLAGCVGWRLELADGTVFTGENTSTNVTFDHSFRDATFTWLWNATNTLEVVVAAEAANGGATTTLLPAAAGAAIPLSAPQSWTNAAGDTAIIFTGWKLFDGAGNEVDGGDETAVTYTHPDPAAFRRLVWQYHRKYRVTASAEPGLTATPVVQWVTEGEAATVVAGGDAFIRWSGASTSTAANLKLWNVTAPLAVTATAAANVRYVGEGGVDEVGHGLSPSTPYASIYHAVADLKAIGGAGVVQVAAGYYAPTNTVSLSTAIRVAGAGPSATWLNFGANKRGFSLSHADACVDGLVISNCAVAGNGGGAYMSAGTIRNCLFANCTASQYRGGGVYMDGGLVEDCEFTKCVFSKLYGQGNAIYLAAGTVAGCDIHHCDGGYSHGTPANGAGVVYVKGGTFHHCAVHNNTKEANPGIYQVGGTVHTCLIYGNVGTKTAGSAGIHKTKGTTYNCTIVGNVVQGETSGVSGINQEAGTTQNCILFDNGPATSAAGSCRIAGGTFAKNVIDVSLGSYTDNRVTGDPKFVDPANDDYHLASRASPAYAYGTPQASVTTDLDHRAYDPATPSVGCYEYDASKEAFGVDISFEQNDYRAGSSVTLTSVLSGAKPRDVSFAWYVDGSETPAGTGDTITLENLDFGRHSVRLVATRTADAATAEADYPDSITLHPVVCYVNTTGSGTFPYATPETATNSINEALGALWTANDVTSVIHVAEGTYRLTTTVSLLKKVRIVGAGRDVTTVTGFSGVAFSVGNSAAGVSGITVANGNKGFSVGAGYVRDCRTRDLVNDTYSTHACAFAASGGRIESCEAVNCKITCLYGVGGGFYITGANAVVSNCVIRNCSAPSRSDGLGGGIYLTAGTITHTIVEGCSGIGNGGAVYATGADAALRWCTVTGCVSTTSGKTTIQIEGASALNCLIARNKSTTGTTVALLGATIDSCTIASNSASATAVSASASTKVYNSILADNAGAYSFAAEATFSHCCSPALAEDENGNFPDAPLFRHPERGDFRLGVGSRCINNADASRWTSRPDALDLDGLPRLVGHEYDIGCYEYLLRASYIYLQ